MGRELQPRVFYAEPPCAARTRPRTPRESSRSAPESLSSTRARRYVVRALRVLAALVVVAVISAAALFAYLYSHYSKIVDARLASGYLTSRAGVYAAPRTLRAGQRLTPERLAEALRRAGYVEGEASRVWNGRFKVEGDAVEIRPSADGDDETSAAPEVVRVSFDRRGQIASVAGDGAPLESYTLDPEPLTSDPFEKTSERGALSYDEVPAVLRGAILSIEDHRFFEHRGVDLGRRRGRFQAGRLDHHAAARQEHVPHAGAHA